MPTSRLCSARFATRRRPERETFGPELATIAEQLGQPFMPWQRLVAEIGGEIDPETRLPAYREVMVTVPRQSGKTALFLSWQLHRCLSPRWVHPQRSVFTAQTGSDARQKWLDELFPLIRNSPLKRFVERITQGMGNESIRFTTGSSIRLLSTSRSSGHGKTLHQAVEDEIWHDVDFRREQALRPAMITIPDAQLLPCSTAGTDASVMLNQKIKQGRAAAVEDTGRDVAYIEFSAPPRWDPFDDEVYYSFHPALCPDPPCRCGDGQWRHTITIDALHAERTALDPAEFARAYGNVPNIPDDAREIPAAAWAQVLDPVAAPTGDELRFGLDIPEDRSAGAITVCGDAVIELLEYRPGVGWILDRAKELADRWDGVFVLDDGGPGRYFADDLRDAGVRVERFGGPDVAAACGRMYDAIADGLVTFSTRGDFGPMQRAVEGLVGKPVGDRRVWSRTLSTCDVSPFYAATLAYRPAGVAEPFALFG